MKPGYQTTEFWVTLATLLAGVVAAVYGLTPSQSADLAERLTGLATAAVALAANAAAVWQYIGSRTALKAHQSQVVYHLDEDGERPQMGFQLPGHPSDDDDE